MLVAVTTAPGIMELQQADPPIRDQGEALIEIEAVGLCGSDFHLFTGHHPYATFPQAQGHEIIGRVIQFGPEYSGPISLGSRVAIEPFFPCGHCYPCRRGRPNCCTTLKVMGAHVPGGLREFLAVPVAHLHPVGDLPLLTAILVEPITIGLQCIVRAEVRAGDTVVIIGAGPIGLAAALGAIDRGARVLVADRLANRLQRARELGAESVVNTSTENLAAAVAQFTGGDGAAIVVEATGVPTLITTALDVVAHSGSVVIVGISDQDVSISVGLFSRKEINILGSRNNTGLFPDAIELVRRHAERIAPLVTHTYPLDQAPEAIDFAMNHPQDVEKVVIKIGSESQ